MLNESSQATILFALQKPDKINTNEKDELPKHPRTSSMPDMLK